MIKCILVLNFNGCYALSSYEHVSRKDMLLYLIYKLTEVSYMDLKRIVSLAEDEGVPFKCKEIDRFN